MQASDFVHLHCHTTYSLLEALPTPNEVVARAHELGQNAVGIADKGYTYGLVEFYKAAKKKGIKPILGLETYVATRTRHDKEAGTDTKRYPLVLLAENHEGYQNLLQLASKAALEGMYYKPRVDAELLKLHGKGLIALSGPISGAIPQAALAEDGERIAELTKQYQEWFGKENVYFELNDLANVSGQSAVNQQLIHWGKELDVPVVATCNAHYCRPEDAEAHDVLLCIQKNNLVSDPNRFTMRDSDFSMRPFEELESAFSHVPEALENTRTIADRCDVEIDFSTYQIPKFPTPDKLDEDAYLEQMAKEGFADRYKNPTKEHEERLAYELKIIKEMGFSGYFLIVADFIQEAKRRGITVGPGRGSAAGSMVSYCLDITTLDPIEHGLLFERFLNPARVTMPDVDIDFADNRRDEVLEYVREKYGHDRVVQICTFGTLAARAAVKDVGRAYGVPFMEMNALAKLIPERPGTTLNEALETIEMKQAYEDNQTYKQIIDIALKLEKKARHVSIHACGVVITPKPAVEYTAVQRAPKDPNITITQYSAKPLEDQGLLKMDFLGLMNLTVIQTTLEIIKRTQNEDLDITSIPMDDEETYKLLQRGETTGVFQLESGGMRRYLKDLKPTEFGDIVAMVSLYRPGPMEYIPSYVKRKHGKEKVKYIHVDLEPILQPTYGIGIYQEQILEIARTFAGFSLGEADLLRRAIGKKIKEELDAQREKFLKGAVDKGYEEDLAKKIFDDIITPFAGYGFNKSHAAGYARIAYETAYLKAKYPTEFMAALLSSDAQRTDRVMIEIEECRNMGIAVLPPDINDSLRHFTALPKHQIDGQTCPAIRFGLTAIKGIGDSSVIDIIDAREASGPFKSIEDFAVRVPTKILNKKTFEALGKAGALDSLIDRTLIVNHYDLVVDFAKASSDVSAMQTDMFSHMEDAKEASVKFPEAEPASTLTTLMWEKETLGMYVSSHPLAGLKKYISKKANLIESLQKKQIGKKVTLAGITESVKKIITKKGDAMAIVSLEDPSGKIEVTLFPKTYAEYADIVEEPGAVLIIGGTLDNRAGMYQLRGEAIKKISLDSMIARAKANGVFDEEEAKKGLVVNTEMRLVDDPSADAKDDNTESNEDPSTDAQGEEENENEDNSPKAQVARPTATTVPTEQLGPVGKWVADGMQTKELTEKLGLDEVAENQVSSPKSQESPSKPKPQTPQDVYTIELPAKAPRQLLLELKKILASNPGTTQVELHIGEQVIAVPFTVNINEILEQKIQTALATHSV